MCIYTHTYAFTKFMLISIAQEKVPNGNTSVLVEVNYGQWESFPGGSVLKTIPANARDMALIPGLGRSPGGGNGNLLQCSCLENPMDRGAWRARVHRVTKNRTQLTLACTKRARSKHNVGSLFPHAITNSLTPTGCLTIQLISETIRFQ